MPVRWSGPLSSPISLAHALRDSWIRSVVLGNWLASRLLAAYPCCRNRYFSLKREGETEEKNYQKRKLEKEGKKERERKTENKGKKGKKKVAQGDFGSRRGTTKKMFQYIHVG